MIKKIFGFIIVLVIGLLIGIAVTGSNGKSLGGTVENFPTNFVNGLYVGNLGSYIKQVNEGTCTLTGITTVATSAVGSATCAATGVKSGDLVQVRAPSTITYGWQIVGASASTTDGYITVTVSNTSATTTVPTTTKSGVQYLTTR